MNNSKAGYSYNLINEENRKKQLESSQRGKFFNYFFKFNKIS